MKRAIVTGANSEIGIAFCNFFLANNYEVIDCIHENRERINNIVSDNLKVVEVDLTKEEDIIKIIHKADTIVNAAAYYFDDYYYNVSKSDFMRTLEVNVVAPFLMIKHLLKEDGIVINVSSTDGIDTYNEINMTYSVSKAALNKLTECFAYASKSKFYALALGWVNTEMIRSIDQYYLNEEMKRTNQKRLVEINEIISEVEKILENKYESGSIIRIEGDDNGD